jgi:hypothetical protein
MPAPCLTGASASDNAFGHDAGGSVPQPLRVLPPTRGWPDQMGTRFRVRARLLACSRDTEFRVLRCLRRFSDSHTQRPRPTAVRGRASRLSLPSPEKPAPGMRHPTRQMKSTCDHSEEVLMRQVFWHCDMPHETLRCQKLPGGLPQSPPVSSGGSDARELIEPLRVRERLLRQVHPSSPTSGDAVFRAVRGYRGATLRALRGLRK